MKKGWLWVIILLVLFAGIILIVEGANKRDSGQKILNAFKLQVENYCNELAENASLPANKGLSCPTCSGTYGASYNLSGVDDNYYVDVEVPLIFSGRNDLPGTSRFFFKVDKKLGILEQNSTTQNCL